MKTGKKNGFLIFPYSLMQTRTKTFHGQVRRLRIVVYMIISTFLHTSPFSTTSGEGTQLNNARYKKAVSTALWIQMILFACYLPFFVLFCFFLSLLVLSLSVHGTRRSSQLCDATLFNSRQKNVFLFLLLDMLRTRQMENLKLVYGLKKKIYIYT